MSAQSKGARRGECHWGHPLVTIAHGRRTCDQCRTPEFREFLKTERARIKAEAAA